MKEEISLEETKPILVDILSSYANFCKQNNLRYFLSYGTLLGAVRHNGFIPWDDDIDVMMPRPDYMRFLDLTRNGLGSNLKVYSLENTENYIYPFAKLIDTRTILIESDVKNSNELGAYIDIFPIDGLPSGEKEIRKHYKKLGFLKMIHSVSVTPKNNWNNIIENIIKKTIKKTCSLYGAKRIAMDMNRLANKYEFNKAEKIGVVVWGYGLREAINKSSLIESVEVTFENRKYLAPLNYAEYLTNIYGNYMELPPIENRVSNHTYKLYWKE